MRLQKIPAGRVPVRATPLVEGGSAARLPRGFGKTGHRGEVIIRLGKVFRLNRTAISLLVVAALNPAIRHAKLPGNADIVVLALRDMQDVVFDAPSLSTKANTFSKKAGSGFSVPVSSAVKAAWNGLPSSLEK